MALDAGTMRCRRPAPGFTLIEVMIAIVVMAIAVPPMFWALRQANVQRVDPINLSRARWLASEKLEDILADSKSTTRGYSYLANSNYAAESPISGFAGFTRTVSITESGADLVSGSGTGYKSVVVTVGFVDGKGTSRTLAVSTVVAQF